MRRVAWYLRRCNYAAPGFATTSLGRCWSRFFTAATLVTRVNGYLNDIHFHSLIVNNLSVYYPVPVVVFLVDLFEGDRSLWYLLADTTNERWYHILLNHLEHVVLSIKSAWIDLR